MHVNMLFFRLLFHRQIFVVLNMLILAIIVFFHHSIVILDGVYGLSLHMRHLCHFMDLSSLKRDT